MYRKIKDHNPLKPLHKFIRSVLHRQTLMLDPLIKENSHDRISIKCFQLIILDTKQFAVKERQISSDITFAPGFDVKATAWRSKVNHHINKKNLEDIQVKQEMNYEFSCDGERFSSSDYGEDIFNVAARHILSLRQTTASYPIYISDLDLSLYADKVTSSHPIHTSHYLQVKAALEYQLNRALKMAHKL